MNKGLFHGWRDIFSFTLKQGINGKSFKKVTIGLAIALFLVGVAISVIMALVQKDEATEVSSMEVVHVIDESGLELLYLEGFWENNNEKYPDVKFQIETTSVAEVSAKIAAQTPHGEDAEGSKDVILHITQKENGYLMSLYLPENTALSKDDGENFLKQVTIVMEQSKLLSSGIPMEKLILVMSNVSTNMLDAGEAEKSIGEELTVIYLPWIFIFFLYLMNFLYGQSMGNVVSVEKTSKLMEMILTMTKPYGLIFGKISAMACIGIMQTVLWISSLLVGFFAGDLVAKEIIYSDFSNILLEIFGLLKNQDGSTAFSIGAFIVAFIAICIGFLFYCVLAGMIASFASKPETLAQMIGYYNIIVVLGFIGAYMLPLYEKEWISALLRILPITSAYMLPGDIVVGNISVLESILYVTILLVVTVLLVIVTGKVYKNQLFYKGTGLKDRFKKKKKVEV